MEFVVVIPVVLIAGFVVFEVAGWWRDPRNRARRALRRAPNVPIAQIKDGAWAKVTGVAGLVEPAAKSPVGQHDCIGYRLLVLRVDPNAQPIVFDGQACAAFSLSDDSGKVVVDGPLMVGIRGDYRWLPVRESQRYRLAALGVETEGLFFLRRFAYRESLLRPGDRVSVYGRASVELDPTEPPAGMRSPAFRIRMLEPTAEALVVADDERASR